MPKAKFGHTVRYTVRYFNCSARSNFPRKESTGSRRSSASCALRFFPIFELTRSRFEEVGDFADHPVAPLCDCPVICKGCPTNYHPTVCESSTCIQVQQLCPSGYARTSASTVSGKPRVPRTTAETENVLDIVRSNRGWILPLFVHKVLYKVPWSAIGFVFGIPHFHFWGSCSLFGRFGSRAIGYWLESD